MSLHCNFSLQEQTTPSAPSSNQPKTKTLTSLLKNVNGVVVGHGRPRLALLSAFSKSTTFLANESGWTARSRHVVLTVPLACALHF